MTTSRKGLWIIAVVVAGGVLAVSADTRAQIGSPSKRIATLGSFAPPRGPFSGGGAGSEVLFARFGCFAVAEESELEYEGTVGLFASGLELGRAVSGAQSCVTLHDALVTTAQAHGCMSVPASGTALTIVCHGDRDSLMEAIAALATSYPSVPLG